MPNVSISSQSDIRLMHVGDIHSGASLSVEWWIALLQNFWGFWKVGVFWLFWGGGGGGGRGSRQINDIWIAGLESLLQCIRTVSRFWTNTCHPMETMQGSAFTGRRTRHESVLNWMGKCCNNTDVQGKQRQSFIAQEAEHRWWTHSG